MSEVVRGVDSVAASLDHITEASVKQSGAVRQITKNIESISDVVQQIQLPHRRAQQPVKNCLPRRLC